MKADARFPKVLFVVGTLGVGGAERQLYYMCKVLCEAGAAPEAVLLTKGEHWEESLRGLGVKIHHAGSNHRRVVRMIRISLLARRIRPDVVQSSHFYTNLYAVVAARMSGAAEIGAIRSDTYRVVTGLGRWGRKTLTSPRQIAVNSTRARNQAIEFGVDESRLFYLPSVVDTEQFFPNSSDPSAFTILNVGRMVQAKRHDRFLRVLRRSIDAAPPGVPIVGCLMGDGETEATTRKIAAELDLGPKHLTFLTGSNTLPTYQNASVFLLTSEYEGTPNVILEAMATGLPVIAGDVGEVTALVADGETGVVTADGDEDAMVEAVLTLATDPGYRKALALAALARVRDRWSIEALGAWLVRLYDETLKRSA